MASRKEEKERLRAQRLAAEQSAAGAARRRLLIGYAVAGLLGAAVLAGLVAVLASGGGGGDKQVAGFDACSEGHFQLQAGTPQEGIAADCRSGTEPAAIKIGDLAAAAKAAGCKLMLDLPDEGNSHLQPSDPPPTYKTSPPTSGNHITTPLQVPDGAYSEMPDLERVVHSLEHGRIEIQYSPKLSEDEQLAIKGVFDEDPDGMLLFPNSKMPYEVAVTAWTQLVGCPKYSPAVLDVIRDFRDTYRGNGPEAQVPVSL